MSVPASAPKLSDAQLAELLQLIQGSDSVELKVTVPEGTVRSTVGALGMDPLQAQIRQIYFFDTPELTLDQAGVVVRARRIQGKPEDSVVKLRPVVPADLSEDLRVSAGFRVEVDALPGGFVCSASMRGAPRVDIREAAAGQAPLRKLFSKEQRAFYADHAPEGIALDDLTVLGPIFVLKLQTVPEGFDRKVVAELWTYPDGSRLLELSTRCLPAEAFQVAAVVRAFLVARGVDLYGEQATKTKRALAFFAEELAKGAGSGARSASASARPKSVSRRSRRTAPRRATRSISSPPAVTPR
jgi:hypothetical protein